MRQRLTGWLESRQECCFKQSNYLARCRMYNALFCKWPRNFSVGELLYLILTFGKQYTVARVVWIIITLVKCIRITCYMPHYYSSIPVHAFEYRVQIVHQVVACLNMTLHNYGTFWSPRWHRHYNVSCYMLSLKSVWPKWMPYLIDRPHSKMLVFCASMKINVLSH